MKVKLISQDDYDFVKFFDCEKDKFYLFLLEIYEYYDVTHGLEIDIDDFVTITIIKPYF